MPTAMVIAVLLVPHQQQHCLLLLLLLSVSSDLQILWILSSSPFALAADGNDNGNSDAGTDDVHHPQYIWADQHDPCC